MKNNIFNITTTVIFILFLSLSFIGLSLGISSGQANTEWRRLAEFPKANSNLKIKEFPKLFEQFYNDNFGFRDFLLRINATIYFEIFKRSPVAGVIKNDKDWYFHNEARSVAPNYKIFYQHVDFSEQQLKKIGEYFLTEKKWLDERNIPYLLVIVPDKEVIYPEYFPFNGFINADIQLSQIQDAINKAGVRTLYLKPQLIKARKSSEIPIYYRQDAHWNSLGAFFGYQAVIDNLKEYFPNLKRLEQSDFDIKIDALELPNGFDLNRLKSLMADLKESDEPVLDFQIKDESLEKLYKLESIFVYGDSYFVGDAGRNYLGGLLYYLRYHFKKMVVSSDPLWGLQKDIIEKEKPDLVIRGIIQRSLYRFYGPSGSDIN